MTHVAILPSRNEPATIAGVTSAVDAALGDERAVIVNADASDGPATTEAFGASGMTAAKVSLTGLVRGKGAQVLAAVNGRPAVTAASVVLIVDTDTRNPDPAVYRALVDRVRAGAALAIADFPRYWDEANLTNHLARPLIAATTGHDIPQPLAGDLAVAGPVLAEIAESVDSLSPELAAGVRGYGIDGYLLLAAARLGPVASVRVRAPKQHAGSFPHLPAIYEEAVPVLLHLTAGWASPSRFPRQGTASYRLADRRVEPSRLDTRLRRLARLAPSPSGYEGYRWPEPAVDAWRSVRSGTSPHESARRLWPDYLRRVRDWLTIGRSATPRQRVDMLATAHARLNDALRIAHGDRR